MTNRTVQEQDDVNSSGSEPDQDDPIKTDKALEAPVLPGSDRDASGSDVGTADTGKIDKGI